MAKKRLFDDLGDQPLPQHVIESLNRQIREGKGQPTYDAQMVSQEIKRWLEEAEAALARGEAPPPPLTCSHFECLQ